MTSGVPTDDRATLDDLGCRYRPLVETFTDTVDYLRSIGRLQSGAPETASGVWLDTGGGASRAPLVLADP